MKKIIPLVIIVVIGIAITYFMISKPKPLKVFNPADINPQLVDKEVQDIQKLHRVGVFNLTDQNGKTVTENDFKENIKKKLIQGL